jgi:hypothetical protein
MRGMKLRLTLIAVLALAVFATPASAASEKPKVVRALLEKGDRGNSFGYSLSANMKRTDAVTFKTRYLDERASGPARYNDNVTTTDLRGQAKHPWNLIRSSGKDVIKLIRASLKATGEATVKIKAENDAGKSSKTKVTFALSECHMDPPLYPLTCIENNP